MCCAGCAIECVADWLFAHIQLSTFNHGFSVPKVFYLIAQIIKKIR